MAKSRHSQYKSSSNTRKVGVYVKVRRRQWMSMHSVSSRNELLEENRQMVPRRDELDFEPIAMVEYATPIFETHLL